MTSRLLQKIKHRLKTTMGSDSNGAATNGASSSGLHSDRLNGGISSKRQPEPKEKTTTLTSNSTLTNDTTKQETTTSTAKQDRPVSNGGSSHQTAAATTTTQQGRTTGISSRITRLFSAVWWVRQVRPALPVLAVVAYVAYKASDTDSLLVLLLQGLTLAREWMVDQIQYQCEGVTALTPLLTSSAQWLWIVVEDFVALLAIRALIRCIYVLHHYSFQEYKTMIVTHLFDWARHNLSFVQAELQKQVDDMHHKSGPSLLRKPADRHKTLQLPERGRTARAILDELQQCSVKEDERWAAGKVSGTVYHSQNQAHTNLMNQVYATYSWSNPLHPGFWPKLNQCEGEVISMTARLLHAPQLPNDGGGIGCITSGGTESILLAIRAHLQYYGKARGIAQPELICGSSAHAAVDKACDIYGIRKVVIDCSNKAAGYQLDPVQVKRHVTSNTIMIYASAPTYPQGVIDPIADLSDIALHYDIGLHVDACLGGFVLPFLDDKEVPIFDFRNPGVTSMSADTHKFGYASKGTSVVVYRTPTLRHGQYFVYPHWTGGMYTTPTLAGSRPGALSACAWAALVSLGRDGYRERATAIVQAARRLAKRVADEIPELQVLTQPQAYMVVCLASDSVDIYAIQDYLSSTNQWALNALQAPASIHLCVTLNVVPRVDDLVGDLKQAVQAVKKASNNYQTMKGGTAGIYGTVGAVPAGAVEPALRAYTDLTLAP